MHELLQSALGDHASDPAVFVAASALLDPAVHGAFVDRGTSTTESAALITDLLPTWNAHGQSAETRSADLVARPPP